MSESNVLLSVRDLSIEYNTRDMGCCKAVNHVGFDLMKGETLGLVGETGAGKTTIARGIMSLVPNPPGKIVNGSILYDGMDLLKLKKKELRKIRGKKISMIFQDPMTALNPVDTVGEQIEEVLKLHPDAQSKGTTREKAMRMLEIVGIPAERIDEYPHQFSGGMKQRIVIAIALACSPEMLIADEPTTALDVTIQAQILHLMNRLKEEMGTSMLLITHDLGVVAEMCNRVAVIYAGEVVEIGTAEDIFLRRKHPYTQGLFDSLPSIAGKKVKLKPIQGMMPDPSALPAGCAFAPRCSYCTEECKERHPELNAIDAGHKVRCIHPLSMEV